MVEKTTGRKEEVVAREYTINLHKRLHYCGGLAWFFIWDKKERYMLKDCTE